MRGDRPAAEGMSADGSAFTPHARGSTLFRASLPSPSMVYPACAGIDPTPLQDLLHFLRLPRMRGDRPGRGVAEAGNI